MTICGRPWHGVCVCVYVTSSGVCVGSNKEIDWTQLMALIRYSQSYNVDVTLYNIFKLDPHNPLSPCTHITQRSDLITLAASGEHDGNDAINPQAVAPRAGYVICD